MTEATTATAVGTTVRIVNKATTGEIVRHDEATGYSFIRVNGKLRKIKTFNLRIV